MDIKKIFIFILFGIPTLMIVGALMALFGIVGSSAFAIAFGITGSTLSASIASGLTGLVLVFALRYGVFRRLPFKRLETSDIWGWYVAFGLGFLVSPYLATLVMSLFGHLVGEGWHAFFNYFLCGFVPVGLALILERLGICKLPSLNKDNK